MVSAKFDPTLYTDPAQYEERPLHDRKAWLDLSPAENSKTHAEFIRDIIAIANTARRAGDTGYLIFGIDDDGEICGVTETLKDIPSGSKHPKRWEKLRKMLKDWMVDLIEPRLENWELEHTDNLQGKPVFYVKIEPSLLPKAYRVASDWPKTHPLLRKEESWVRIGESKHLVDPDSPPYCYTYDQVPYILPSTWSGYFTALVDFTAAFPEAYQDLYATNGKLLDETVQEFLDSHRRVLVIEGEAGGGKTEFMKRWVYEQAQAMKDAAQTMVSSNEYDWTPALIPVYFSLRAQSFRSVRAFANALIDHCHRLSPLWKDHRPKLVEKLFENTKFRWILCLDGLDEIWSDGARRNFVGLLSRFSNRYPHIKIVLTTRPPISQTLVEHPELWAMAVQVRPFFMEQIENYVATRLNQHNLGHYIDFVLETIRNERDFQTLCGTPLFLSTALETLAGLPTQASEGIGIPLSAQEVPISPTPLNEDAPLQKLPSAEPDELLLDRPVSDDAPAKTEDEQDDPANDKDDYQREPLPLALRKIYEHLWRRERNRRGEQRLSDPLWPRMGKLALKMDGRCMEYEWDAANRTIRSQRDLNWLLNLGILRSRRMGWIAFGTQLTQVYFAAEYLRTRNRSPLWEHCTPTFKERVHQLLAELHPNSPFLETEVYDGKHPQIRPGNHHHRPRRGRSVGAVGR